MATGPQFHHAMTAQRAHTATRAALKRLFIASTSRPCNYTPSDSVGSVLRLEHTRISIDNVLRFCQAGIASGPVWTATTGNSPMGAPPASSRG